MEMKQNLRNICSISICSLLLWLGLHLNHQVNSVTNQQQIIHTISRTSFGITPQQIATIQSQGLENYLQAQLNPSSIPESPDLTDRLAKFDTIGKKPIDLYRSFQQYNDRLKPEKAANLSPEKKDEIQQQRNQYKGKILRQARQAHLTRVIASPRQLQEVMTDFWLSHFNVFVHKKIVPFWIGDYANDLRNNALGNFRDLLGVTAHHPAMLVYLDNDLNTDPNSNRKRGNARGLNENYARELMELHTLGVDGGYTQQDVTTLAKIFTGWGVDYTGKGGDENSFRFFEPRHDSTSKVFLGHNIETGGIIQGEKALDILASHTATAHFISYKLAQYFVADKPPETLVDLLAKTFLDSQGNIKTVLNTLLHSSEFNNSQYHNAKFKTPLQYMISIVRASGLDNPELTKIEGMLGQLAMPVFGCETPNGYQNTKEAWLNPNAMLRRVSSAVHIANGSLSHKKPIEFSVLKSNLDNRLTPQTKKVIAEAKPNLKAALILGSPEMMYR